MTGQLFGNWIFGQHLRVSDNHRYLVNGDGTPFFYLGDTAWELFHRLTIEEAGRYLENRAAKGFTVIQAVVLAERDGLTDPNANGDLPLLDADPAKPVEAYFNHVDAIVNKAASLGLVIGMLPTWGRYWSLTNGNAKIFTPDNARDFGEYLGKRYRDKPIIWILGGDENINNVEERNIIVAMAEGLRVGDDGNHLMTFHPRGPGFSSDYFHRANWLDFNMFQSSHGAHDHDNGLYAEHDYQLTPVKPTLDGEPRYELIQAGFYFAGSNRMDLFTDYDARQAAYWSILSGACGHTYGHASIWQMWDEQHESVLGAVIPWHDALDHPGAFQMKHLKKLFEARPFHLLAPDQSLIVSGSDQSEAKIRSARATDGSYAIIYSPKGKSFTIDKSKLKNAKTREIWYDPRYGISFAIHTSNTLGIQTYTPHTSGKNCDWILIIEDADRNFLLPGKHRSGVHVVVSLS
ncbi:MAG: glycoside hydrolase family 140 protein [Saprospiraceae bacterium]|nr:glycoside hydrolase family 140 protein [Saprospiraceae bacterium]